MENEIKKADVNDLNFMKQYLKDLYTIEKEKYCSEQAKDKISNTIGGLGRPKQIEQIQKTNPITIGNIFSCLFILAIYGGGGAVVGFVITWILSAVLNNFIFVYIGLIVGIIIAIYTIIEENQNINYEYKKNQREIEKDKERVDKENELIVKYRNTQNLYLKNVNSCNQALKQLYDLDIIFPKYRNFIAISQIYEYYMSGRCTSLEGHEGAYNIFESEARQNIIILQLNNVLNQLEQIKQNQYLIYQAIKESNSILAQIESNSAAIAYNTSVIAENSAICARYAESRIY